MRTGREGIRAVVACLATLAFLLGVLPIGEWAASAQQRDPSVASARPPGPINPLAWDEKALDLLGILNAREIAGPLLERFYRAGGSFRRVDVSFPRGQAAAYVLREKILKFDVSKVGPDGTPTDLGPDDVASIVHEIWHAYREQVILRGYDPDTKRIFDATVRWLEKQRIQDTESNEVVVAGSMWFFDEAEFVDEYVGGLIDVLVNGYLETVDRPQAQEQWRRAVAVIKRATTLQGYVTKDGPNYRVTVPPLPELVDHLITLLGLEFSAPSFKPYRLFTFADAAKLAPGINSYYVSGHTDPGDRDAQRKNSAAWGPSSDPDPAFRLADPKTVSSGLFSGRTNTRDGMTVYETRMTRDGLVVGTVIEKTPQGDVYGPVVAIQDAGILVGWTNWGNDLKGGSSWAALRAQISITAFPFSESSLQTAIARGIERGMLPVTIDGFAAVSRSPANLRMGFAYDVVYVAVKANFQVEVQVKQSTKTGNRVDFPAEPHVVAEHILRTIGERLGHSGGTEAPFPRNVEFDLSSIYEDLAELQQREKRLRDATISADTRKSWERDREITRRKLGINLGRYESFLKAIGVSEGSEFYPKVYETVAAIRAAGIEPLPELAPTPPAAQPDSISPRRDSPRPAPPTSSTPSAPSPPGSARPGPRAAPVPRVPEPPPAIPQLPSMPSPVDQILRLARHYDKMPPEMQQEFVAKIREVWPKLSPEDRAKFPAWLRKMMGN
ncbi:MAG: hypothetical protein A3I61_15095 [Acidobacteria bacterium RIFCSPLOWO2_02_FULL_68_18]|nr:MAG: hypothetical protein A3I61_15095 [Acidobacteria bacterium RIFCSPLOWO2_02_FULL_68_18]